MKKLNEKTKEKLTSLRKISLIEMFMIVLLEASRIQEAFLLQRNKYLED